MRSLSTVQNPLDLTRVMSCSDILQAQQIGNHTSVNLRQLTECVLRTATAQAAATTVEQPPPPCEKLVVDHRQRTLTTTEYMFKKLFTYPDVSCGYVVNVPQRCAGPAVVRRRYAPQPRIETICQTNQRPVASTITAQVREAAAATKIHQHYERPLARPLCPPLPPAPQAGVPRATCGRPRT